MSNQSTNAKRRQLLKAIGVTGAAVAVSGVLSPLEAVAATGASGYNTVQNVASLASLSGLSNGDVVFVAGYYKPGDGGQKTVVWNAASTKDDNGGTVHAHPSYATGRFEVMHGGAADYRWFGVMDMSVMADAAFAAMAEDTSIKLIEAKTNLHFKKRHKITRSNLTLDFGNNYVITEGIATAAGSQEAAALFNFSGKTTGSTINKVITEEMKEYNDVYEFPAGTTVAVGEWYTVMTDSRIGGGSSEREIQRMARVTEIVNLPGDSVWVRLDYESGYTITKGRTMSYQKVAPIADITVKNMKFVGNGAGTTGSHPVSFYYGVRCNVDNLHATDTFAAVVMRSYCTHFVTENSSLSNPPDIVTGGRGYFTQQMHCLYGHIRNCKVSMARHLNDFTACSHCLVENCHSNGDVFGAFVTHGQFEHDLMYINTSGLMSFANSGATWGSSAKNIVVKRHSGPNLNGGNKVTNLTLEDCHIVFDYYPNQEPLAARMNGTIHINCDGAVVRNCTASNMLYLWAKSSLSDRPTVIENSSFTLLYPEAGSQQQPYLTSLDPRITKPVTFKSCRLKGLSTNFIFNNAPVTFDDCQFEGVGNADDEGIDIRSYQVNFTNCRFNNIGIALRSNDADQKAAADAGYVYGGAGMQRVVINDCTWTGKVGKGAILVDAETKMPVLLEINGLLYNLDGNLLSFKAAGKLAGLKLSGCTLLSGATELVSGAAASNGHVIIYGNFIENHKFVGLPSNKQAVANVTASGVSGL